MKIIDISWPISGDMTQYKDRQLVFVGQTHFIKHDGVSMSSILVSSHTGTHIDAPSHFLQEGKPLSQVPLETHIGKALVIDCTGVPVITKEVLSRHTIPEGIILLCKTDNSKKKVTDRYDPQFVAISECAARYLIERKIKAVGLDYPGLERGNKDHVVHALLLGNEIGIIEGLRLEKVEPKEYFFCCLPIALQNTDGAPARAVLIEER